MADARTNRKLAAILAADVVGYSRMMASDEAGTLVALKREGRQPEVFFREHMLRQPYTQDGIARIREGLARSGLPE